MIYRETDDLDWETLRAWYKKIMSMLSIHQNAAEIQKFYGKDVIPNKLSAILRRGEGRGAVEGKPWKTFVKMRKGYKNERPTETPERNYDYGEGPKSAQFFLQKALEFRLPITESVAKLYATNLLHFMRHHRTDAETPAAEMHEDELQERGDMIL